jgi:plastocyanin
LTDLIPAMTPARNARAGVFLSGRSRALLALLMMLSMAACDRVPVIGGSDEGPRVLELDHDTIRLEGGVRLIDVAVRRNADGDFDPPHIEARQGDVIRFTSQDRAGHAIAFLGAELAVDVQDFLARTGQMRSPPFITDGASWVITLEDAPAGEYQFHCTTHDARGRLTVTARE